MGAKEGDPEGVIDLGEAAHIHAASPRGARFDENQTPEQRKHISNGIYLCRICARSIDDDPGSFPAGELKRWKAEARRTSFLEATRGQSLYAPTPSASVKELTLRVADQARVDVRSFMAGPRWPEYPVKLDLHLLEHGERSTFNADSLATASASFNDLVVVAPPGTGKSTSLIQITDAVIEAQGIPSAFVRLSGWASSGFTNAFGVLAERRAFRGTSADDLASLAAEGALCLAFDGWNELSDDLQQRAGEEISELRRQYPALRLILSTRRQAIQVPLDGPIVEIAPLTDNQQLEISTARRGEEGRSLVDQAWRTPGLRELVTIPFYLDALLKRVSGAKLPTTRNQALELLVSEHEADSANAAAFRSRLHNEQGRLLAGLALRATTNQALDLSEGEAATVIGAVRADLISRGPSSSFPEPLEIVDLLVDRHCLVREAGNPPTIAFQHQQIQEWYASRGVAQVMLETVRQPAAVARLMRDFLNVHWWEEPILFACEQLSASGEAGEVAVADAIANALEIDPVLGAEMIYRSSEAVWARVKDRVIQFVERWHKPGAIDRAFRFMMTSARPEFADVVWPLITGNDEQTQLHAIRMARRFRVRLLGEAPEARIQELPEKVRRHLLSEIARAGGYDGMQLATTIASRDPDTETRYDVIQSLDFRSADHFVAKMVEQADQALWDRLAAETYPESLADPAADATLQAMRTAKGRRTETTDQMLYRFLHARPGSRDLEEARKLIASAEYPVKGDRAMAEFVRRFPQELGPAALERLEAGLEVPSGLEEALQGTALVSDAPAVAQSMLLVPEQDYDPKGAAAAGVAGEASVRRLLQAYVDADAAIDRDVRPYPEPLIKAFHRYERLLAKVNPTRLVTVVQERAGETDPHRIGLLAGVIASAGGPLYETPELQVSSNDDLASQLVTWSERLLSANNGTRGQLAQVADAIGKVGSATTIPILKRLLAADLQKRAAARAERAAGQRGGPYGPEETTDNTGLFARAFAAIGGAESVAFLIESLADLEFGHEAALALLTIWERTVGPVAAHKPFFAFSMSRQQLLDRQRRRVSPRVHIFARPILEVVERLSAEGATEAEQAHAFRLASIALAFPHGDDTAFSGRLLDLPGHRAGKLRLLISMVAAGLILSADRLLAGVELLYEDAKAQRWLIEGEQSELRNWLHLFAYCDRPEAALDLIAKLPDYEQTPWSLRSFTTGLARNPSSAAEGLLKSLSERDPRFFDDHEWRAAVIAQGTLTAIDILLDGFAAKPDGGRQDAHDFARHLALLMDRDASIREAIYDRFAKATSAPVANILEEAIRDVVDEEGIVRLIERYAADGRGFKQGSLSYALERLALGERASDAQSGWREVTGVPLTSLRRRLFAMTAEPGARAELAKTALIQIDRVRDDYGSVEGEPRHPDIDAGRPWPMVER